MRPLSPRHVPTKLRTEIDESEQIGYDGPHGTVAGTAQMRHSSSHKTLK